MSMKEKIKLTEPYNLFYTTDTKITTFNRINSISFSDLFCPSLGRLKATFLITGALEINWLLQEYKNAQQTKTPLTVFYSVTEDNQIKKIKKMSIQDFKCVNIHQLDTPSPDIKIFKNIKHNMNHSYSKLGIFVYEDNSLRVVVFTANLTYDEWNCYTQGVWISPVCPVLSKDKPDKEGESATKFKSQIVAFLKDFEFDKISQWLNYVKRADFKSVRVVLLTQTVGDHHWNSKMPTCLMYGLHELLKKYCNLKNDLWDIAIQVSSVGNLGVSIDEWFLKEPIGTLAMSQQGSKYRSIKIIYPTQTEVESNSFGLKVGEKVSFWMDLSTSSQRWALEYLNCWNADKNEKAKLLPQVKSYCRISECQTKLAWFMMTTANMSISAWGRSYDYRRANFGTRRTEIGVLFLPNFFDEEHFKLKNCEATKHVDNNNYYFPVVFDVPLRPYGESDKPWVSQKVKSENILYEMERSK